MFMQARTGRKLLKIALLAVFCLQRFAGSVAPVQAESSYRNPFDEAEPELKLGAQVPLDLVFTDSAGKSVRLGDIIKDRPVILNPVYLQCPMLCTMTMDGLLRALRVTPLELGEQFDVITFSFVATEGPDLSSAKKDTVRRAYDHPGVEKHWHFLTGDEANIKALTDAIGFRFAYDAATQQYLHSAGILVLTPDGRVSRYLQGIEYSARDVRLSLVEASEGEISSIADTVFLLCYQFDPSRGKYTLVIFNGVRMAGAATVVLILGTVVFYLRRERTSRKTPDQNDEGSPPVRDDL